jgi:hypothetical protein
MRSLYFGIAGCLVIAAIAVFGWTKRDYIKNTFNAGVPKVEGMARSTWGRVSNAASDLLHTERDPQVS